MCLISISTFFTQLAICNFTTRFLNFLDYKPSSWSFCRLWYKPSSYCIDVQPNLLSITNQQNQELHHCLQYLHFSNWRALLQENCNYHCRITQFFVINVPTQFHLRKRPFRISTFLQQCYIKCSVSDYQTTTTCLLSLMKHCTLKESY